MSITAIHFFFLSSFVLGTVSLLFALLGNEYSWDGLNAKHKNEKINKKNRTIRSVFANVELSKKLITQYQYLLFKDSILLILAFTVFLIVAFFLPIDIMRSRLAISIIMLYCLYIMKHAWEIISFTLYYMILSSKYNETTIAYIFLSFLGKNLYDKCIENTQGLDIDI